MKTAMLNIIRDDSSTGTINGTPGADHLIHHRSPSIHDPVSTNLASYGGDDTIEASTPDAGQSHMYAGPGDDLLILDLAKAIDARGIQGHHAYGGSGKNTFHFTNLDNNHSPIVGRIDDFNPTSDKILVENTEIDLTSLPQTVETSGGKVLLVRVIEVDHPEFILEGLGTQHFLAIGDDVFYALEGARDLVNGTSGKTGEERHFLHKSALDVLRSAESVEYVNPKNFVPQEFYEHRESDMSFKWAPQGIDVALQRGDSSGVRVHGSKQTTDEFGRSGAQTMRGGDGDDVIDGNTGNDTIHGGQGDDLIAGGIDNDAIYGGSGNDMLWGGDGDDRLYGNGGNDYLHGGRGDDTLVSGAGDDTLSGGRGNNLLVGSDDDDAVTRFHFYADEGQHQIEQFNIQNDFLTFQDNIDPSTIQIFQNSSGNTSIIYGENAIVELVDVSLEDFQSSASERSETDSPVISITPDPEQEILLDMKIELGLATEEEESTLLRDDVLYGNEAFSGEGAGGYTYVTEEAAEGRDAEDQSIDQTQPPTGDSFGDSCHQLISEESSHADCGCGLESECLSEDTQTEELEQPEDDVGDEGDTDGIDEWLANLPIVERDDNLELDAQDDDQDASLSSGSCFVATASFRCSEHPDVVYLRHFRDTFLKRYLLGRVFISVYWKIGPILAIPVSRSDNLAACSRFVLHRLVSLIRILWK